MIEVDQTMDKGWPSGNLLNFGVHLIPYVHGWAGIVSCSGLHAVLSEGGVWSIGPFCKQIEA